VLVLAPELYLPLRQLGAQFHASADGIAVAERILALIGRAGRGRSGGGSSAAPARRRGALRARVVRVPVAPGLVLDGSTSSSPGRDRRARRRERRWEEHGREPAPPLAEPTPGA
jgi:hypothetical protein